MNTESSLESLSVPTVPRPKWRIRHPTLNYIVTLALWSAIGLSPGILMIFIYNLSQQHHVALTAFQTSIFLAANFITIVFGILLGLIVGLLMIIAEKINPEL